MATSRPQPNILLITTDQQRSDTVGPEAPPFLMTPHVDLLTREGVRFSRAYAESPLCVPSRVSIMTGRSVFSHGMLTNGVTSEVIQRQSSLPSRLAAVGYQTVAIGKMHFGPQRARHGFDEMIVPDDYYFEMQRSGNPVQPMRHGLGQNELYPGLATVPEPLTLTAWIADQAARFVLDRRDPTTPFFLWVSFSKPHPPLDPPEPYASMYRDAAIPAPVIGAWRSPEHCPPAFRKFQEKQAYDLLPAGVARLARAAYYGLVTQVDYNMGRVLSALQDLSGTD
jgi:arylsulfatase